MIDRRGATFSACGAYRYSLERNTPRKTTAPLDRRVVWIMLNPSIADESKDDPTIRKVRGFSDRWGFNFIQVVNLFALRSTNSSGLLSVHDPIGPYNDGWIIDAVRGAELIVCAWGANVRKPKLKDRPAQVMKLISGGYGSVVAVRLLKDGIPEHRLMLPYDCQPVEIAKAGSNKP